MKKKEKKKTIVLTAIIILLLFIIMILGFMLCKKNNEVKIPNNDNVTELNISDTQSDITDITKKEQEETEYTNFVGYGELIIDQDNPYIFLQNPSDNTVFMQFDVTYNDELIYQSEMIEPGKQDQVDVFAVCEQGKQKLIYTITTYDVETKELCMAGINQEQEINVIK